LSEKLEYFVPFLLYRVMARGLRQATSDYGSLGLGVPEARVLIVLAQHRGRIRAGSLAEITCIEASALSHLLRGLSRRGLVTRERVASDNRSIEVALTSKGWRVARVCVRKSHSHERVLLRRLTAGQQKLLRTLLHRMYDNAAAWARNGETLALAPRRAAANARKARRAG